jgi:hypothetical protein
MPLDTRIALGVQPLQLADPLAREGQVQNILASQAQQRAAGMQQQSAQMQMDQTQRQLRQDEDYVSQMADAIGKNGGPPDMEKAARLMATNRNPDVSRQGVTMLQSLQRLDAAKKAGIYGAPAPVIPNAGPTPGAMGSGTFGMDQNVPMFNQRNVPPLNLTTPAPAPVMNQLTPPAAAPVNQLAAAPQADVAKTLQAEFTRLSQFTDLPGVKERMDLIKEQLKELSTPRVVGRNLVTGGGKTIFTAPQDVTLSPLARLQSEFAALLPGDPRIPQYVAAINKETTRAAPPVVNISNVTEKAEAADYGKLLVKDYDAVKASASLAQKSIPALESNLAILNKGFDTGSFTESKAAAAKVLGALGVKEAEKYATDSQAFLANASAAVLQRQLEQKGPQTEADAQRITQTGAQLGNTKAANEFVLKVAKAQLQRDIEQRDFYAAWRDKNQTFNGAENAWNSGPGSKSLFDRPELKAYAAGPNVKEVAPDRTKRLDQIFGARR